MRIDAHQHFWQFQKEEYAWISDDLSVLRKDFLPPDLKMHLESHSVDGCIAVEARGSEVENTFLIRLAEKYPFIKGIVGWLDLRKANLEERLDYYSTYPIIKGFRYDVQNQADPNFLLGKEWVKGLRELSERSLTFDILIFPHQLGAALELVRLLPNQRFVIDHLAKPYIENGYYDGWATLMKEISQHENVWCKVSGMLTEASWTDWKYEDFVPYLDLVFQTFGTNRVMFGSDWPVCLLAGEYGEVINLVETYTKGFSAEEKKMIFGENALRFYQI